MAFRTEFPFVLPRGYVDANGAVYKTGVMRLATAKDEIAPLQDYRVQSNRAYLVIILLSRVVVQIGTVPQVNPKVIEALFVPDLTYLQELYNEVNRVGRLTLPATCPKCDAEFEVEMQCLGG